MDLSVMADIAQTLGCDVAALLAHVEVVQATPECLRGKLDHFKLYAAPGEWIVTDLEGTAADLPPGDEGRAASGKPLTVREAAARLGISARTVYKLFEAGALTGSRRGAGRGRVLIDPRSLAGYQAATATAGPASVPATGPATPAPPASTPAASPRKPAGGPAGLKHLHLP
jgi:excisionase family DNA binding protein